MPKKLWAFLFCIFLLFSCSEEENNNGKKPKPNVKTPADRSNLRRGRQQYSADHHIQKRKNASSRKDRISEILRMSNVKKEDYSRIIPYLTDILKSHHDPYEKIAAASSLIEIGTKEALEPVKKVYLFFASSEVKNGILAKLKKKYGKSHKNVLAKWCVDILNQDNIFQEYNWKSIYSALGTFEFSHQGKGPFLNPRLFLQANHNKITMKMYDIMKHYPAREIPVEFIMERISRKLKERTITTNELEKIVRVYYTANIPVKNVPFNVEADSAIWALNHTDPEMRRWFAAHLKYAWNDIPESDKTRIRKKLDSLVENDPVYYEGEYPVRQEIKRFFAFLNQQSSNFED